ncbi:MAG: hypothetical protein G8D28_07125 [gamma proteobacterium symbiont of Phacoides pectinatus]
MSRVPQGVARGLGLAALIAAAGVRADTSPAAGEGLGGWEVAAIVFALGMVLSLFHSVSLLRNSARPGPAYWLGRASSACAKSDARAAEQALLLWVRAVWGDAAPSSLLEIADRLKRLLTHTGGAGRWQRPGGRWPTRWITHATASSGCH